MVRYFNIKRCIAVPSLFVIIAVGNLIGCTPTQQKYAINSTMLTANSIEIYSNYSNISGLINRNLNIFDEIDKQQLKEVEIVTNKVYNDISKIVNNLQPTDTINILELLSSYDELYIYYTIAHDIISKNLTKFNVADQTALIKFNNNVQSFNKIMIDVKNSNININGNSTDVNMVVTNLLLIAKTLSTIVAVI